MIVVEIDCATDPKKVGIVLADCDERRCSLIAVELGKSQESLARKIASSSIRCSRPRSWSSAGDMSTTRSGRTVRSAIGRRPPMLLSQKPRQE